VITFEDSYARLPADFHARLDPTPVAQPRLLLLNEPLADELGLDARALETDAGVALLAGNRVPEGARPIAMAYAGHQFGNFVPQLGDGRAILLGELIDREGQRRDVQLKGSGRTPFSRGGDGRAALGPVLREYVVSEAMAALGIPTTRALAAVRSGEPVYREGPLPGAVLTRVARGHIRVGTFEYFAARDLRDHVRTLADYVIARAYPECAESDAPYLELLRGVCFRQADLIARWLGVGFIHGVMNTDNMSVLGETIDYGPCAFMDAFDPGTVYSSIDHRGRYAFGRQPTIGQWNLARFAETLLPLLDADAERAVEQAQAVLADYAERVGAAYRSLLRTKLGLLTEREEDDALATDLLERMHAGHADYTLTFRGLSDAADSSAADSADASGDAPIRALFDEPAAFDEWVVRWRARIAAEGRSEAERRAAMRAVNPRFTPRNHRVEQALAAAIDDDDLKPIQTLLGVVTRPFDDDPDNDALAKPPEPHEVVQATFCGT